MSAQVWAVVFVVVSWKQSSIFYSERKKASVCCVLSTDSPCYVLNTKSKQADLEDLMTRLNFPLNASWHFCSVVEHR